MNKLILLAVTGSALSLGLPAYAQHLDVLAQVVDGKLVTGAANYDNNTWLVGQRVYKRQLLSNFRTPDPGFTSLETGNPLLEPGVLGLAPQTELLFDIVPTTIDGQRANFWWWDGMDTGGDGFGSDEVAFELAPTGVTWNVFDQDFTLHTADGTDTVVPGALIQETFSDGAVHNHLVMQVADSDGSSQTTPPQGVYLAAMVLRAEGYEPSEPFFFVHRTSGLTNEPRDIAAQWVEENYALLVEEPLPGDFNLDGIVDAADYTVWQDGFGVEFESGEYNIWRNNYGSTASAPNNLSGSVASVPEPAVATMLAAIAAHALIGRREVDR